MRLLRTIGIGLVLSGVFVFVSGAAFAQDAAATRIQRHEAKVKLLQDSAAALQQSNPELAKGLSDMAGKESKEMQDMQAKHEVKAKLLKDAAAALAQSNPTLANGLLEMTGTGCAMAKEKCEKEEAKETH